MATVQRGRQVGSGSNGVRAVVWSKQDRTIARNDTVVLSDRDVDDIVAFLKSLSSDTLAARNRNGG